MFVKWCSVHTYTDSVASTIFKWVVKKEIKIREENTKLKLMFKSF